MSATAQAHGTELPVCSMSFLAMALELEQHRLFSRLAIVSRKVEQRRDGILCQRYKRPQAPFSKHKVSVFTVHRMPDVQIASVTWLDPARRRLCDMADMPGSVEGPASAAFTKGEAAAFYWRDHARAVLANCSPLAGERPDIP